MEKEMVKGVLDWLISKEVKNIQKFLELANYYQWFIKYFTFIARPLYDLVKKNQKWDWIEKQEKAFKELKERFTKELVFKAPDLYLKMRMEVNMSDYAIRGILSMKHENRKQRLVAYLLKSFNKTERNYEIFDKKNIGSNNRIRNLKASIREHKVQVQGLDRP